MKDTSFSHKNMYLLKVVSQLDTNNSKSFARCSAFIHIKQGIEAAIVVKDADTSWRIGVSWRQMLLLYWISFWIFMLNFSQKNN